MYASVYTLAYIRLLLNSLIGTPGTIGISPYRFFRSGRRCSVRSADSRSQPQRRRESARFFGGDSRRDRQRGEPFRYPVTSWTLGLVLGRKARKKHRELSIPHVEKKPEGRYATRIGAELEDRELMLCSSADVR